MPDVILRDAVRSVVPFYYAVRPDSVIRSDL